MAAASIVPALLFLAPVSGYSLFLSYNIIIRLQHYESQSEKAAEWSKMAAARLHKTRTTQATGAIAISVSLFTSVALVFPFLRSICMPLALLNTLALISSRIHFGGFWNAQKQTEVPFVEKFNEAVRGSERLCNLLGLLAWGWGVAATAWWAGLGSVTSMLLVGGVAGGVWSSRWV
ncbi:hypothetical protein CC78DRAFT_537242 [Lojkania enalia]|uniref:Uncharacterized protein n=1 Tax=Lojkania enalia TaxID=147567 RepID=A0A9P4K0T6_9PLEO|nr:hypothetical protein CC78DRAFT_537242 [Didymosphaeria enalia]